MSHVAVLNALGTDSQPDELAQLLADGWAVDDRVIQFYGDMSDQPYAHVAGQWARARARRVVARL